MKIYGFADAASDADKNADDQPPSHKRQQLLQAPFENLLTPATTRHVKAIDLVSAKSGDNLLDFWMINALQPPLARVTMFLLAMPATVAELRATAT